jgi:integrase
MRPAEVFSMRWSWVEEVSSDHWLIVVPASSEKTARGREIPVSPALLQVLKASPKTAPDALVFPNDRGEQRHDIREAFAGAVKRAELAGRGLTPYCLRRTRISVWDSIDPAAARIAAGHSPVDVHEKHYVRIGRARLFRLVGIELQTRVEYKVAAARCA